MAGEEQNDLDKIKTLSDRVKAQMNGLEAQNRQLRKTLSDKELKIERQRKKLKDREDTINQLTASLKQLNDEHKIQIEELQKKLEEKEKYISVLQTNNELCEEEIKKLKNYKKTLIQVKSHVQNCEISSLESPTNITAPQNDDKNNNSPLYTETTSTEKKLTKQTSSVKW